MNFLKKIFTPVSVFGFITMFSFFLLRDFLKEIELFSMNNIFIIIISGGIAGLVGGFLSKLLFNKETLRKGVFFLCIYVILSIIMLLQIIDDKNKHYYNMKIGDVWTTKESDGQDFVFNFYSKDSLRLIQSPNEEVELPYKYTGNNLKIYEDNKLIMDFRVKLEHNKLIVSDGNDDLIFYRSVQ